MYNPYQTYTGFPNLYQPHSYANILPQQQVIQVSGKASVDSIQLAPNSSVLVMDTSAPIVWMCISDGVGKVTATPYDISEHKDPKPVDTETIDARLTSIEERIKRIEATRNDESNVKKSNAKQTIPD